MDDSLSRQMPDHPAQDPADLARQRLLDSGLFDAGWYRRNFMADRLETEDALAHFLSIGTTLASPPGPLFDSRRYLQHCWFLQPGQDNALHHYVLHGAAEGQEAFGLCLGEGENPLTRDAGNASGGGAQTKPETASKRFPVESTRLGPVPAEPQMIAVAVTMRDAGAFERICQALRHFPCQFTLMVVASTPENAARAQEIVARSGLNAFFLLRLAAGDETGFAPLLRRFANGMRSHGLILHLRAEPQDAALDGALRALLPPMGGIGAILARFAADPELGLLHPAASPEASQMADGRDDAAIRAVLNHPAMRSGPTREALGKIEIPAGYFAFPKSGMFWVRSAALGALLDVGWSDADGPMGSPMDSHVDAQILAQCVALLVRAAGLRADEQDVALGLIRKGWSRIGTDFLPQLTAWERFGESPLGAWRSDEPDPAELLMLGPIATLLFGAAAPEQTLRAPIRLDDPQLAGKVLLGPLLLGFMAELVLHPALHGVEKLFFLSREGYFLHRIYDDIRSLCGMPLPESVYFHCSRRVAITVSQADGIDAEAVTNGSGGFRGTMAELLLARCGFSAPPHSMLHDLRIELPRDAADVAAVMEAYAEEITSFAHGEREALRRYTAMQGLVPGSAGAFGLVDVGYGGTVQSLLQRVLGVKFHGFYMATTSQADQVRAEGGHAFGLFGKGETGLAFLLDHGLLIEALLAAPHGQTIGYDPAGAPLFGPEGNVQAQFDVLQAMFDGARAWCLEQIAQNGVEMLRSIRVPRLATAMLGALRAGDLRLGPAIAAALSVEDEFCGNGEIHLFAKPSAP